MSFLFWSHVDLRGDDECWLWTGYHKAGRYGHFGSGSVGTRVLAHRYAFELVRGPIPEGLCVLHDCDTPTCVNPAHLHLGTVADNNAERNDRRREARGEKHGLARLTDASVRSIRTMLGRGRSQTDIATEFGVARKTIYQIARGRTWKHVTTNHPERRERPVEERS